MEKTGDLLRLRHQSHPFRSLDISGIRQTLKALRLPYTFKIQEGGRNFGVAAWFVQAFQSPAGTCKQSNAAVFSLHHS
ncbi:MAG: hypothetical protein JWO71_1976 [Candidatus Acidoferrum typicum]|nr:hypothetical protein [Candidatus Acidoferrum typicum]